METWLKFLLAGHVLVGLTVIACVLLQHGKGADMGSGFGGGSSGSLFGATGSANFLSRATAVLATIFFASSLGLAYLATSKPQASGVMEAVKTQPASDIPQPQPKSATDVPAPAAPADPLKPKQVPN